MTQVFVKQIIIFYFLDNLETLQVLQKYSSILLNNLYRINELFRRNFIDYCHTLVVRLGRRKPLYRINMHCSLKEAYASGFVIIIVICCDNRFNKPWFRYISILVCLFVNVRNNSNLIILFACSIRHFVWFSYDGGNKCDSYRL